MVRIALLVLLAGCDTVTGLLTSSFDEPDFSGDEYPIVVDRTQEGAVLIGVRNEAIPEDRVAVLDILSPVTLVDRGSATPASIETPDLLLLGLDSTGNFAVPRARILAKQTLTLHPCQSDICSVGEPTSTIRDYNAVLGLDAFSSDALRLRLGTNEIFVLPDIAGDETHLSEACQAVMPSPYRGGGTMLVGGTELTFQNFRVTIDTCLAPRYTVPDDLQSSRGANVLLVASTGIGISLLDYSAYDRYREVVPTAPEIQALPEKTVIMPSGPLTGRLAEIESIALVGNSGSNPRAPCRQVFAHHKLAEADCLANNADDCPCTGDDTFCAVPAIVELKPAAKIQMLIVPDGNPTLQALRTELRPDRPEVDGILGANALADVQLDLDYQHTRMLVKCTGGDSVCKVRPQLPERDSRTQINNCIGTAPGPVQ